MTWPTGEPGVLSLPSGRRVRGRSLRRPPHAAPDWGLYLVGRYPTGCPWPHEWVRWPDFWLPSDGVAAWAALDEAWRRAEHERVEIACGGGVGRTGTALAALAIVEGMRPDDAIALVRCEYHRRAVETPWQRGWLRRGLPARGRERG